MNIPDSRGQFVEFVINGGEKINLNRDEFDRLLVESDALSGYIEEE